MITATSRGSIRSTSFNKPTNDLMKTFCTKIVEPKLPISLGILNFWQTTAFD